MTPTIVLKDNKPYLSCRNSGWNYYYHFRFSNIVNVLEFDMSASDAVNKPKFHHQWLPDEIFVETGFPVDVKQKLEQWDI